MVWWILFGNGKIVSYLCGINQGLEVVGIGKMKKVNVVIERACDGGYGAWSVSPNQGIHAVGNTEGELWENLVDAANDCEIGRVFVKEDFVLSYDIASYVRYYWGRVKSFFKGKVLGLR